jgi:hypothetical protein
MGDMPAQRFYWAIVGVMVTAAPILAKEPPRVNKGSTWVAVIAGLLLAAAIIAASIMTSKRGHQD